jgi:hypothetical protein
LTGTPAIARPRRLRCLPICAATASLRPGRWLHRTWARWAIRSGSGGRA